jgi:hypothetical protein
MKKFGFFNFFIWLLFKIKDFIFIANNKYFFIGFVQDKYFILYIKQVNIVYYWFSYL